MNLDGYLSKPVAVWIDGQAEAIQGVLTAIGKHELTVECYPAGEGGTTTTWTIRRDAVVAVGGLL